MPYDRNNTVYTRLSEAENQLQQTKIQMEMYKRAVHMMQKDLSAAVSENTCLREDLREALTRAEKFEKDYNMLLEHFRGST